MLSSWPRVSLSFYSMLIYTLIYSKLDSDRKKLAKGYLKKREIKICLLVGINTYPNFYAVIAILLEELPQLLTKQTPFTN